MFRFNKTYKVDCAGVGIGLELMYSRHEQHGIRPAGLILRIDWFTVVLDFGFWWFPPPQAPEGACS